MVVSGGQYPMAPSKYARWTPAIPARAGPASARRPRTATPSRARIVALPWCSAAAIQCLPWGWSVSTSPPRSEIGSATTRRGCAGMAAAIIESSWETPPDGMTARSTAEAVVSLH